MGMSTDYFIFGYTDNCAGNEFFKWEVNLTDRALFSKSSTTMPYPSAWEE